MYKDCHVTVIFAREMMLAYSDANMNSVPIKGRSALTL